MANQDPATFDQLTELEATAPTLIEGLPGVGLVASITVNLLTRQLDLEHHGNIVSDDFPSVATFQNGLVRDLVRVYGGVDPNVLTLQSDLALPPYSFEPLAKCIIGEFSTEFDRAIFIAGVPAESENRIGDIAGIGTTEAMLDDLEQVNIERATDPGIIGGTTGAIVKECYHGEVPAIVLIVRAHPFLPDPGAAQRVINEALEPLVEFSIDTSELQQEADEIQQQLQQLAQQYQQMQQEHQQSEPNQPVNSMFQ